MNTDAADSDTTWTIDQYNSSVYKIADAVNPGNADVRLLSTPSCPTTHLHASEQAIDPDLSVFAAAPHNGKLLHYVGLTDEIISPRNSFHYYDTVRAHTLRSRGMHIDDFYRLFPAPGMDHW